MADSIQTDIDQFFKSVDVAAASSQALGQDIPLLGANLANVTPAPLVAFKAVQADIDRALAGLGTGATAEAIADALNGAGVTGLTATVTGPDDDQVVAIGLQTSDTETVAATGATLDLGVPALDLRATADFDGALTSTLHTTLDYDVAQKTLALDGSGAGALDFKLGVTVAVDATAALGPLAIAIVTDAATPATPQVALDITAGLAAGGTGISVTNIAATGNVNLGLGITTSADSSLLPTITTDLKVGYALGGASPTVALDNITVDLGGLIDELAQTIAPITMLFNEAPFKQILKGLLGPVPILNDAANLIPALLAVLDTVPAGGDGRVSPLDLAGAYFELVGDTTDLDALQAFAGALAIIKQLTDFFNSGDPGANGLGKIDLGSIQLVGDTSGPAPAAAAGGNVVANVAGPTAPTLMFTGPTTDPAVVPNQLAASLFSGSISYKGATNDQPTQLSTGLVAPAGDTTGTAGVTGLSIPLLDDLSGAEIERILLPALFPDQPAATLISYTIPTLSFNVPVPPTGPVFLPIVGPFGLTLGGSFGASLGFTVGYNTTGLTDGKLADGLYLSATQADIASITGEVEAGLGVDLGVVEASINGGIEATVGAALAAAEVPLATFTQFISPTGRLAAEVDVVLTVGFGPFSFTIDENIVDITIIDFSAGNAAGTIDQAAMLASPETGNGGSNDIVLNAGSRAGDRQVDPHDDDERFQISNSAVDVDGNPTTDTLDVAALGVEDLFGVPGQPIEVVNGDLGDGNNTLTVDPDVTQTVQVSAGDGNNTFTAGGGTAVFKAGRGSNNFYGAAAPSLFISGAGSNFYHPGSGPVTVEASANGHNQVTYANSPTAVTVLPNAYSPGLSGTGGTAQGDYLSNVQSIIGSGYGDILVAQRTVATTLDGGAGNDTLIGGDADDFLIGGPGADHIDGGLGENGTSYITSTAGVDVDLATGFAAGGEATGDVLLNIQDLQGSIFDDVLTGTPGVNRIDGDRGDDVIDGEGGADFIEGGAGNDTLYGHGDGAMLDGGSGQNTLDYQRYGPVNGVGVTVNLATGQGAGTDVLGTIATDGSFTPQDGSYSSFQTLIGSQGDDTLIGDSNIDRIEGGAGNDILVAGAGNATLTGGAGADTLVGLTATDPADTALVGGGGIVTADYSDGYGVTVNLTIGTGQGSTAEGDRLYGVSNLVGSPGADRLTGDGTGNIIDPGLSGGGTDQVDGGGGFGIDTLVIDYSKGDLGAGIVGGFGHAPPDGSDSLNGAYGQGSFQRMNAAGSTLLDAVDFTDISRLDLTGTVQADMIFGGGQGDRIATGDGNDVIYEAKGGPATIEAGNGDDTVYYGTAQTGLGDGPFFLDGGAGIDTLSISLRGDASAQNTDITLVGSTPGAEFTGTNLTLPDGSAVVNFEILKNVTTANGNDTVAQSGVVDNVIATGFGQDVIAPGLGADEVDGGYDFTPGKEITAALTDSTTGGTYYQISNEAAFLENGGDQLNLDYSGYTGAGGVIGTTTAVESTIDTRLPEGATLHFDTTDGVYSAGANHDDFGEIERLNVIGSSQNDVLVGTENGFDDLPTFVGYDGLGSQRGADVLQGGGGDDVLIGLGGSDVLIGGDGNDLLIGGEYDRGDGHDQQEIDSLTGGAGADTFVLGTAAGSFYDDFNRNGPTPLTVTTRAIITDFTPADGDTIELYDKASDYVAVQSGTDTLIYDRNASTDPQDYTLVGQVQNFRGLDLTAAYVTYDARASRGAATDLDGNPVSQATIDLYDAETGVAIQPLPAGQAADVPARHAATVPQVTAGLAAPAFTVTQDNNPNDLAAALVPDAASAGIDPSSQTIQVSGNAAAFGTFSNDPFGLGSGIVLSTGKVTDIVGPNTYVGSTAAAVSKTLTFVNIGTVTTASGGNDVVYRAELTGFGTSLGSLTLTDGNTGATDQGGGGVASGFDLDGIVLSQTLLDSVSGTAAATLNDPAFLPTINAFDFSAAGLKFTPGTQKPGTSGYAVGPDLLGSTNGLVNNTVSTLQTFDGAATTGALSLGDGGSLGLNLTQPVSTSGSLYLYVAEAAAGGTGVGETIDGQVAASSQALPQSGPLSTDFGPPGAAGDTTSLTYTFATTPGSSADTAYFTFALFTQDLPALAGAPVNDQFKITLNGVSLAVLSDGAAATINNLEHSPDGVQSADLVLNTGATAAAHDVTAVDAYTRPLTFAGALNPAGQVNTLVVQVADAGDGLLDSGILIKGGTFKAGAGPGSLTVGSPGAPLVIGAPPTIVSVTLTPGAAPPTAPVTIVLTPSDPILDFGAGGGQPVTVTIQPGGPYTVDVPVSATATGVPEAGVTATGSVTVTSTDPRFDGTQVAPIVVGVAPDLPVDYHWAAAVDGDFGTASDWNPAGVPTGFDHATLDAPGDPYTVTVSGAEAAATLTVAANATIAMADGPTAALSIGISIANAGTIALDSTGDDTALLLGSSTNRFVQLTGGGHVILSDSAGNVIEAAPAGLGTVLDNVDNTISGAGRIDGRFALSLSNGYGGTIDATGSANALVIGTTAITNGGLIEDTGTAGLRIESSIITSGNYGGTILASGAGAHIDFGTTVIDRGTLLTTDGGVINVSGILTLDNPGGTDIAPLMVAAHVTGGGTLALGVGETDFEDGTTLSTAGLSIAAGAVGRIDVSLDYAGPVEDAGGLVAGPGATVHLSGQVTGGGQLGIDGNGTLELDRGLAASQTVEFSYRGGTLVLNAPADFQAPITGFIAGDALDLRGESVASVSYSGTTLTATLADASTQTFCVAGDVTSFTTHGDGDGGSLIVASGDFRLPYVDSITVVGSSPAGAYVPSTVTFEIVFYGLAIGFDASHIALSGLPGAAVTGISTQDDSRYRVSVSTGTGSGNLQIQVTGNDTGYFPIEGVAQADLLGTRGSVDGIATGSFAGPGSLDIASTDTGDSAVNVLAENQDGTATLLGRYSTLPAGGAVFSEPEGIAIGDFNGDGKPDIAVANSTISYPDPYSGTFQATNGNVAILTGNGDGSFQPASFASAGGNEYPTQIAAGDFDGDGRLDLVTANFNGYGTPPNTVSVLHGNGDGTFSGPVIHGLAEAPGFVAVGDLTGQGHSDTVISTDKGVAIVLDGDFASPTYLDIGATTGRAAIGDLNGDGRADLVVPTQAGLAILLGNGDGTFSAPVFSAAPVGTYQAPVIADLTGDGVPDIVASTGEGFALLAGNGDGTFTPLGNRFSNNTFQSSFGLAVADVNGDDVPDVIVPLDNSRNFSDTAPIDTFLNSSGPIGTYLVDRTPATASLLTYTDATAIQYNDLGTGHDLTITVIVDKPFTTSGAIVLQLSNGATVAGVAGTYGNTLVFDYVPLADDGEDTPDLTVTGLASSSGAIIDPFGNDVAVTGDTGYAVDTVPPTVISVTRSDPAITAADTVDYVVTFSEPVPLSQAMVALDPSSTALGAAIASVVASGSGDATTYDIAVGTGDGDGTLDILLGLDIADLAGNPLAMPPAFPAYTIEHSPACYCRGTSILTEAGEVSVEDLAIGDRLVTASGAVRPIKWIGYRSYVGRFLAANPGLQPILFRAGSLGNGLPRRDLSVSRMHAMFLDGLLIPAGHLVNHVTIEQERDLMLIEYYHVELESHDVILAEGAASETFLDDDSRGVFHNAHEFHALYPAAPGQGRYCAPRVESGYQVEAIRRRLAAVPACLAA